MENIKRIESLIDLFEFINYVKATIEPNFEFDDKGWPVFNESLFLDSWPENVISFYHRNSVNYQDKANTLICFYEPDKYIYRRFCKVEKDIEIYKKYLGVVFPDLTVTWDMDIEFQEVLILANHMFAAFLAYHGIKLVFNTRCGCINTHCTFKNIPSNIMCSSGFLGCSNSKNFYNSSSYINKILELRPSKLLIYGKRDYIVDEQLNTLGINYKYYQDFHTISKLKRSSSYVGL